jgi:hypothetical protein
MLGATTTTSRQDCYAACSCSRWTGGSTVGNGLLELFKLNTMNISYELEPHNLSSGAQHLYSLFKIYLLLLRSSTSHKKTTSLRFFIFPSFRLSLREFMKILPNKFIYEILIKFYTNTNIMNTQIFHFNKYDLKDH